MPITSPFRRPRSSSNAGSTVQELDPTIRVLVDRCRHHQLTDRIEAGFLGSRPSDRLEIEMGTLRAGLFWDSLSDFLDTTGWSSLGQLGVDPSGDLATVEIKALPLSATELLQIPTNAMVLAERDDERSVFRISEECAGLFSVSIRSSVDPSELMQGWRVHVQQWNRLRGRSLRPSGQIVGEEREWGWDDLHLQEDIKSAIAFQLKRFLGPTAKAARELGVRRRGGVILSGEPGTGKTMIGRIMASQLDCSFIWVTPGQMGDSDEVQEVLGLARLLAPAILFLEDLDLVAEGRRGRVFGGQALGELMNQLDGCMGDDEIFTIATTNRLEVVEEALRNRPGRFDRIIEIDAPDHASCRSLLRSKLAGHGLTDDDFDWLADQSEGRTGAELEELANTILLMGLEISGPDPDDLRLDREIVRRALSDGLPTCGGPVVGFGS